MQVCGSPSGDARSYLSRDATTPNPLFISVDYMTCHFILTKGAYLKIRYVVEVMIHQKLIFDKYFLVPMTQVVFAYYIINIEYDIINDT